MREGAKSNLVMQHNSIDFDESMEFCDSDPFNKRNHPIVALARELYTANNITTQILQEDPIIPKILHIIWLGPKVPPMVSKGCMRSIAEQLPDWEIKLWTDKDIQLLDLQNRQYFEEETNYGAKSDILRYELLYKFGGVYIDIDIEVVKSLTQLNHAYEFYAGLEAGDNEAIIGNSIIASIPGHPIMKDCIDQIKEHRYQMVDWKVVDRTGPKHFEQSVLRGSQHCDQGKFILFPKSFFYPISHCNRTEKNLQRYIKNETYCIHHWAGSWITDPRLR